MPYLKLHRDEPETLAPQPLSFLDASSTWRTTGASVSTEEREVPLDSIAQVELALSRVESTFESLNEQVDELCEPIRMADWLANDDDGPWAA